MNNKLFFILAMLAAIALVPLFAGMEQKQKVKYLIGPEDRVRIYVERHPEVTVSVPVGPDGFISFPMLGNIEVTGMTREELQEKLTGMLKKYYKKPMVSVMIEEYNSYRIAVLGEVENPGLFTLKSDPTVMHALSLAGGPTQNAALDEAYLKKAGEENLIRLDLYALLVKGDVSRDMILNPGDVLYVPKGTKNQLYVLGEVGSPGVYQMKEGLTVLEAIAMAGSETDKAIMRKVSVIRKTGDAANPDVYIINVDKILKEGKMKYNLALAPGDVIYIPKSAKPEWDRIVPMLTTIGTTHSLIKGW
ncbi:MAG: polysaccharide export protein [Candidatus Wallbacteria bacterium]|nr:polysaccharide export protein [Candidatus Wallbacteria bacterium]